LSQMRPVITYQPVKRIKVNFHYIETYRSVNVWRKDSQGYATEVGN
jgi:hypothetical protein